MCVYFGYNRWSNPRLQLFLDWHVFFLQWYGHYSYRKKICYISLYLRRKNDDHDEEILKVQLLSIKNNFSLVNFLIFKNAGCRRRICSDCEICENVIPDYKNIDQYNPWHAIVLQNSKDTNKWSAKKKLLIEMCVCISCPNALLRAFLQFFENLGYLPSGCMSFCKGVSDLLNNSK